MRIRELGLLVLLAVLFVGGVAAGAKGAWGFSYEEGYPRRHYPHGYPDRGYYHYCPPHYGYDYHYRPYYGYGWREYRRPCPDRNWRYRNRGYYGFYYESR